MADYNTVLRGGMIYDGSGTEPFQGDVAIQDDVIAAIDAPGTLSGARLIDVDGLAVAPGFINMLSWATESLIIDGNSQSDIRQGVTLEVMGEGASMGPLNAEMKARRRDLIAENPRADYEIAWTTLGEYLQHLEQLGVSPNVTSFVGSSTLRVYAIGYEDRDPTPDELHLMKQLTHQAMQEGAVGLSTALIYPPATFAKTPELIELAKVVSEYDGLYISHIRSEGSQILQALDEFLTITREAAVRSEVYHLKAAGVQNWPLMDDVIAHIEAARAEGLQVTADMYTYPASGTGLTSCLPPWVQDGGHEAMMERLRDLEIREQVKDEMTRPADTWENMYSSNSPENILLAGFKNPDLKHYTGKRLSEVCALRGTAPKDTVLDLILEDDSRIFTIYFSMTEDNLRKQVALPWLSFCSDAGSLTPEYPFDTYHAHPRAYGSFARVLGKYVRDEGLLTLQEAVRKLAALPADVLKIQKRGRLQVGHYADIAVFDPALVQDHATFENPHQYSTGMLHVFVNGGQVLRDGEHTGARPGRVVRGPGYNPNA
jgi:N-acyl-D-amino-acid deacylase